jgi:Zn-dependent peptidase ImmA (M78 family)
VARLSSAERLLHDLGITEPKEIDLEAIAFHAGARVRRQPLDGCEARIVGHGDRAIITVNARSSYRRNRFSIAHELGHNAVTGIMPHGAEMRRLLA